jgi:hypothetical protein
MWTLEQGLKIARALQNASRDFGYHLTLGGGVLNNGKSDKDLDLYFLPFGGNRKSDPEGLVKLLEKLWGPYDDIMYSEEYRQACKYYEKAIKIWRNDQRIDAFIFKSVEESQAAMNAKQGYYTGATDVG